MKIINEIKMFFKKKKLEKKFKIIQNEFNKISEETMKLCVQIQHLEYNSDEYNAMNSIIDKNHELMDSLIRILDKYSDEILRAL